jgi:riboflavin kinase/FMN adenylyltransferase
MLTYRTLEAASAGIGSRGVVATIGNFDGVHLGHQYMFSELIARGRALGLPAVAITLQPHTARMVRPHAGLRLLTPLPQKLELLAACGLDATIVLPFTADLAHVSAQKFASQTLCNALHVAVVVEGSNFRFGHHADHDISGLAALGRELGFKVIAVEPLHVRGDIISSSRIRHLVSIGDVRHARALLGRPVAIASTPASGRGYGTRYTVPTINLAPYNELLPGKGVFVSRLTIGDGPDAPTFDAVTNIGNRPTFGADSFSVETHILNFTPIALDESTPLRLTFLHRLRDEVRWPTAEALKAQIARDVEQARRYLRLWHRMGSQASAPPSPEPPRS